MSGERKRIEDIKKRKKEREKALKRKIYMLRRVGLVVAGLIVIAVVVFGIKSCVSSIQVKLEERRERIAAEQAAIEAAKPTPVPTPFINKKGIDEVYFRNSAFVGNSFIDGMFMYDLAEDTDYFSKVGLNVSQAMTDSTDTGTVPVIDELNQGKKYSRVFLMFGENEVGWIGDSFFVKYKELINKVKEYQPDAKIYVMAITAISKKVSDGNIDGLSKELVETYNTKMMAMSEECNVTYVDLYKATVGEDGYLPADAATDGIHFGEEYYIKCLKYIQDNHK